MGHLALCGELDLWYSHMRQCWYITASNIWQWHTGYICNCLTVLFKSLPWVHTLSKAWWFCSLGSVCIEMKLNKNGLWGILLKHSNIILLILKYIYVRVTLSLLYIVCHCCWISLKIDINHIPCNFVCGILVEFFKTTGTWKMNSESSSSHTSCVTAGN